MESTAQPASPARLAVGRFVHFDGASALGVGALTLWAGEGLPTRLRVAGALLSVAGTLFIYNLDHLRDARHDDARTRRLLLGAAVALGAAALVVLPTTVVLACVLPGVLGVLHRPLKRAAPAVKSLSVAFAVASACVAIPAASRGAWPDPAAGVFLVVLVALNAHASDLLDLDGDRAVGVRTLASVLGAERTRAVFTAVAAATALGLLYAAPLRPRPEMPLTLVLMTLLLHGAAPRRARLPYRLALECALAAPLGLSVLL